MCLSRKEEVQSKCGQVERRAVGGGAGASGVALLTRGLVHGGNFGRFFPILGTVPDTSPATTIAEASCARIFSNPPPGNALAYVIQEF